MNDPTAFRVRRRTFSILREPSTPPEPTVIATPEAATNYLLPFFRAMDHGQEHFGALFCNNRGRPIAAKILFSGGAAATAVHPGVVARNALLLGACAVIMAHNHPSGNLVPSAEDHAITRRLSEGLALLDIRLIEHLVIDIDTGAHRSILP